MKKTLATIGIITGTAFAGMGMATVASAQVGDDASTDTTEADSSTDGDNTADTRNGERREGRRGGEGCNKGGGRHAEELRQRSVSRSMT